MNIIYKNWNAFEEGSDQFQYVIDHQPRASELYERAKELTEASEFKGKLKLSMWIYRDHVWFTIWIPYNSPEFAAQFDQKYNALEKLIGDMESHHVDVEKQVIVIFDTAPNADKHVPATSMTDAELTRAMNEYVRKYNRILPERKRYVISRQS